MNKLISSIKQLDLRSIEDLFRKDPKWINWSEETGKNALHYLCGITIPNDFGKAEKSLQILKVLLKSGMSINSVHKIPEGGGFFPGTALWYAYTRGRNEKLYTYLLKNGADPENCMFAIAWYDDVKAAVLFKRYGANIEKTAGGQTPMFSAFLWRKFDVAEWFLKNGANVNHADEKGNTALFYAVKRKYDAEQIKMLLKFGADVNMRNLGGISPKKLAELNHQRKILNLFKD